MNQERTFIAIKPDGVQRGYIADIVGRFEKKGFKLVGLKQLIPSKQLAQDHYGVHKERPFYNDLVQFMTSGPVVVQVLEGDNAVLRNRELMGATNPAEAEPGTIRREYAESLEANSVHGSDSLENAKIEIDFFFGADEIVG